MRLSNYDKYPATKVTGTLTSGWDDIVSTIQHAQTAKNVRGITVDFYTGVYEQDVIAQFAQRLPNYTIVDMRTLMKSEDAIRMMTQGFMTDDVLFGYISNLRITDFIDTEKMAASKQACAASDTPYIYIGIGASMMMDEDDCISVYVDMARWEIQQRFRRSEVKAVGLDNRQDPLSIQHKRGYFIDWRLLDKYKDTLYHRIDYWLDTHIVDTPKMIDKDTFFRGIEATAKTPFRVVPFFDPAPWGGQWMKEVCDLDRDKVNFGWCFDCVPEENSLYLCVDGVRFEMPSVNLILLKSKEVLGGPVEARFGKDFPIRFDFLDTMGGGNLSLQVHPTKQFIYDQFGMHYTQDESYYLLDADENATVYLGLKRDVDRHAFIADLQRAQDEGINFDAEKYVNKFDAKKHDHYLIPGGTIHCSGGGSMVLEISATPNLFTFKLWDWGRLGLDGKPRPINIERGSKVIDWTRDTDFVKAQLYNNIQPIAQGDGWSEERTGLHELEFMETRRHRFTKTVPMHTRDGVHVLNLVDGREATVASPTDAFAPFVVHYAETFIIPACVGAYTITPSGESEGKECMTIQASIRFKSPEDLNCGE